MACDTQNCTLPIYPTYYNATNDREGAKLKPCCLIWKTKKRRKRIAKTEGESDIDNRTFLLSRIASTLGAKWATKYHTGVHLFPLLQPC